MALVPWRRPSEIQPLRREMDDLLSRFFGDIPTMEQAWGWTPSVDVSETENNVIVKAELPGLEAKDIDVDVSGNLLTLRGEKKKEEEKKEENYYCRERYSGSFQRSFRLPSEVQGEKAEAEFKNGILTINIPKSEESRHKKIEIKESR